MRQPENDMEKKTVILAMPTLFGFCQMVEENLRHCGFDVTVIAYEDRKYEYQRLWDRIRKFWHRHILGDRNFKKELLFDQVRPVFQAKLDTIQGQADYCFMIWPGVFPNSFMQSLRQKSKKMVHYNWEALDFLGEDFGKIDYFDRFLFFDPYDIGRRPEYAAKLVPTASFYFDCLPDTHENNRSLFFIGSHAKQRVADIRAFYQAAQDLGLPVDFRIAAKDLDEARRELGLDGVHYFPYRDALPYRQTLLLTQKAGVLVDFLNTKHYGLSLRVFEAIGFDKKLITTNPTVVHYDFYHPDNIFVWNGTNRAELAEFLQKPLFRLPEDLKRKYSFGNWIRFALDIPPYQAITLPKLPPKPQTEVQ